MINSIPRGCGRVLPATAECPHPPTVSACPEPAYHHASTRSRGVPLSAALTNIVIGLVTSILTGGSVWAWQRARDSRVLRRKAAFFGLRTGGTCLIVMNHKYDATGATAWDDVHAMIEIAVLAHEAGSAVSVKSCDETHESNADRTEFCIGGLNS